MMSEALKMLDECEDIDVINIVSTPPAASVQQRILNHAIKHGKKKLVMTFIGNHLSIENTKVKKMSSTQKADPDNQTKSLSPTLLPHRSLRRQNLSLA